MRFFVFISFLIFSFSLHAQNWTWNGVFTQGVFHTDNNNIYGESDDDLSFDFSEFSLNGSYNFPNNVRAAGQTIYRHAGAGSDGLNLDYLVLDYQFLNDMDYSSGIRLGRMKLPYGIYNEARDVMFTRPSIYLPQSVYLDLYARESLISGDGIGIYTNYFNEQGLWNIELNYGQVRDENLDSLDRFNTSNSFLDDFSYDIGEGISYRFQFIAADESFTIAYSGNYSDSIEASTEFDIRSVIPTFPVPAPIGVDIKALAHWQALSFQYLFNSWTFTFEYGRIRFETETPDVSVDPTIAALLPPGTLDISSTTKVESETYYLQVQKRLTKNLQFYTRMDFFYPNKDDRKGSEFEASGLGLDYSRFAKDTNIGVQWMPKSNLMMNAEYHYVDGTAWLNSIEEPNYQTTSTRYWNIWALSLSYRF